MKTLPVQILAFFIGILLLFPTTLAASFPDIPASHPQYNAIESLKNLEIVKGYSDGTFQPNKLVNRVEALKMILLSAKIEMPSKVSTAPFSDVPTDQWFAGFVQKAKEQKIVSGDGTTGNFIPTRTVKQAEFLKMLLLSFGKDVSKHQGKIGVSPDVPNDAWFLAYMSYAKTLNIISPDSSGNLFPQKELSRAQCAEIIYKLLLIERGGDTQKFLSLTESKLITVLLSISKNDITTARTEVDSATFYSGLALEKTPSEGIVQAANEIALAMKDLVSAYEAGLAQKTEEVKNFANLAKEKAGTAYGYSTSTQPIGKKIKQYADSLLSQIGTE